MTTAINSYKGNLPDQTIELLHNKANSLNVATVELVGASIDELHEGRIAKYYNFIQRFTRAIILGLGGILALDFYTDGAGALIRLSAGSLFSEGQEPNWTPTHQLEELKTQMSRAFKLSFIDATKHIELLEEFTNGKVIEAATETVSYQMLKASALLPIELSPISIGTIAQVLDGISKPCCVRIIIAPLLSERPDTVPIIDNLSSAEHLVNDSNAPRAVAYRARAVTQALRAMLNSWLGQACSSEIQILYSNYQDVSAVIRLLQQEIARPKKQEIRTGFGDRSFLSVVSESDVEPVIAVMPDVKDFQTASKFGLPLPSYWLNGISERPKHITAIETASRHMMPPLPQFCNVASISTVVVEERSLSQPHQWISDRLEIGKDALGNSVSLDDNAISKHVHLIGVTGCGKTTLMNHMVRADLEQGRGLVVLDPHGDFAKRISSNAGWNNSGIACNKVFPGLRLLTSFTENRTRIEKDIGIIIEAIETALPRDYTGPRFRQLARACLMLHAYVGDDQPIADSVKYAQEEAEWDSVRLTFKDRSGPSWVSDFFVNHHRQRSNEKAEVVDWFASKFCDYLRTEGAQQLFAPVGQGLTAEKLINEKFQLVIDFATLGASVYDTGLLGQLFVTSFLRNLSTINHNPEQRFLLYLDEVQLFFGPAVEKALQESRKYGLSIVAAHQTSSQLPQERFDSLMSQVGLEFIFRCSLRDASIFSEQLQISSTSITALPDMSCWVSGNVALQRGGNFVLTTQWNLPRIKSTNTDTNRNTEVI